MFSYEKYVYVRLAMKKKNRCSFGSIFLAAWTIYRLKDSNKNIKI